MVMSSGSKNEPLAWRSMLYDSMCCSLNICAYVVSQTMLLKSLHIVSCTFYISITDIIQHRCKVIWKVKYHEPNVIPLVFQGSPLLKMECRLLNSWESRIAKTFEVPIPMPPRRIPESKRSYFSFLIGLWHGQSRTRVHLIQIIPTLSYPVRGVLCWTELRKGNELLWPHMKFTARKKKRALN